MRFGSYWSLEKIESSTLERIEKSPEWLSLTQKSKIKSEIFQ
jgi:hypothetical protein